MASDDKNLDEIYEQVRQIARAEVNRLLSADHWGTVRSVSEDGKTAEVLLDGGESTTPCATVAELEVGDRALVNIDPVARRATVKGNATSPSASGRAVDAKLEVLEDRIESSVTDKVNGLGSIVEQRVSGITSTVSDLEGRVSQVEQDSSGFSIRLAGVEDDIDSLESDVEGAVSDASSAASAASAASSAASAASSAASAASSSAADARRYATDYLSFGSSNKSGKGLDVGYSGTKARTNVDSNGVTIYDPSNNNVAFFGSTARVGKSNAQHISLDSNGMTVYDTSAAQIARFASDVTIGKPASFHSVLDSDSMDFYSNGSTMLGSLQGYTTRYGNLSTMTKAISMYHNNGSEEAAVDVGTNSSSRATVFIRAGAAHQSGIIVNSEGISLISAGSGPVTLEGTLTGGAISRSYFKWTQIASTTGSTAATIDLSSYNEVCVVARWGTGYLGSVTLPKEALHATTEREVYLGGGWNNSNSGRIACAGMTRSKITPKAMTSDGTSKLSGVTWTVYAR